MFKYILYLSMVKPEGAFISEKEFSNWARDIVLSDICSFLVLDGVAYQRGLKSKDGPKTMFMCKLLVAFGTTPGGLDSRIFAIAENYKTTFNQACVLLEKDNEVVSV